MLRSLSFLSFLGNANSLDRPRRPISRSFCRIWRLPEHGFLPSPYPLTNRRSLRTICLTSLIIGWEYPIKASCSSLDTLLWELVCHDFAPSGVTEFRWIRRIRQRFHRANVRRERITLIVMERYFLEFDNYIWNVCVLFCFFFKFTYFDSKWFLQEKRKIESQDQDARHFDSFVCSALGTVSYFRYFEPTEILNESY